MRLLLGLFLIISMFSVNAGLMDENGKPRTTQNTMYDIERQCHQQGYFLINTTLYMCAVVRKDVTKEEYDTAQKESGNRMVERFRNRIRGRR